MYIYNIYMHLHVYTYAGKKGGRHGPPLDLYTVGLTSRRSALRSASSGAS